MSTPFDIIFGEVATDLIELFGVQQGEVSGGLPATLPATLDSAKGSYTVITFGKVDLDTNEAPKTVNTHDLDMSPPIKFKIKDLEPGLIEAGDCQLLIAGRDWDAAFPNDQPKVGDILSVNNVKFFVINPNPIYSGNDVAVYKMQVRQGHAQ